MIELSAQECQALSISSQREWLVTNGIGGYACGTVAGMLSRNYHGMLIAALNPPLGRTLLVAKLDETAIYRSTSYPLSTNHWGMDILEPHGYRNLDGFRLEGAVPVWTYALDNARLEKRVWMEQGENTTYAYYTLKEASHPIVLHIKMLVNYRDYHQSTVVENAHWQMDISPVGGGLKVVAFDGATPFYVFNDHVRPQPEHIWYHRYFKSFEAERGLPIRDDHLYAGRIEIMLQPGESLTVVASTDSAPDLDGAAALERRRVIEQALITTAGVQDAPDTIQQLVLAADQFIIERKTQTEPNGRSVLAGFPWFSDWGRDTMIALPGLTLTVNRPEIAAQILRTFSRFVDRGMLPNRFPDAGETPEYNTVDATLWYFEAIRAYHAQTQDNALLEELFPVLEEIIRWHRSGTRYQIHVDPSDGLLYSGEAGVQLTWMDAKIDDWVITPRTGKAVEICALWYNALCSMEAFARTLGHPSETYGEQAAQVKEHFNRFWNGSYCYDVIDSPTGDDATLRPNQLIAVSIFYSPVPLDQAQKIVEVCERQLLTPRGLRSLSPEYPAYVGRYIGSPRSRDAVYHQGTVWAWLIGPFIAAHLRAFQDPERARALLMPMLDHLRDGCIGTLSEIFDGDSPHLPRGCFAQAWSVSEVLRIWQMLPPQA